MSHFHPRVLQESIRLRNVSASDLPTLFEHQRDPDAHRMAVVHPRNWEAFQAHWTKILADEATINKAILAHDRLVGHVSCFSLDGKDTIGYWIAKDEWGKGIATRALQLLLEILFEQQPNRTLHAQAARSNIASIRVLEHCGFQLVGYHFAPANDRYPECEAATLKLEGFSAERCARPDPSDESQKT